MRITHGVEEARTKVMQRAGLEAAELPLSVRNDIRRLFGAELSVEAVVDRILADVSFEGDTAVRRYNREIDGVEESAPALPLKVSRAAIESLETGKPVAIR